MGGSNFRSWNPSERIGGASTGLGVAGSPARLAAVGRSVGRRPVREGLAWALRRRAHRASRGRGLPAWEGGGKSGGSRSGAGGLAGGGTLGAGAAGVGQAAGGASGSGGGTGASHWVGTWGASPYAVPSGNLPPASLSNSVLRQVVHGSLGGSKLRLQLSNKAGNGPLTINSAHLALCKATPFRGQHHRCRHRHCPCLLGGGYRYDCPGPGNLVRSGGLYPASTRQPHHHSCLRERPPAR